jgi:hypothetical protein
MGQRGEPEIEAKIEKGVGAAWVSFFFFSDPFGDAQTRPRLSARLFEVDSSSLSSHETTPPLHPAWTLLYE